VSGFPLNCLFGADSFINFSNRNQKTQKSLTGCSFTSLPTYQLTSLPTYQLSSLPTFQLAFSLLKLKVKSDIFANNLINVPCIQY